MRICPACRTEVPGEQPFCVACGRKLLPGGDDSLVGRTLGGRFLVEALVGEGAMGRVYRARRLPGDEVVAIKVLQRHLEGSRHVVQRFRREARAASRLDHPNSLRILDVGQTEDGILFMAMEHVEGVDLHAILGDVPLGLDRIASLVGQVCDLLDAAHAAGIVHRDIKPENIMVVPGPDGGEVVKVCDFGMAKIQVPETGESLEPITRGGVVCGTPEYMSPEQARGEALDGRSDIYSAGVILYQLATGQLPHTADTPLGVVSRRQAGDPTPPSRAVPGSPVALALEGVILRAMARSPGDRYRSAAELKADLLRAAAGRQVDGVVPGVQPRASEPRRGARWPALVHRMLGACYYRVGRIERGRAAYRRYLELRPDAPDRADIEAIIGG
jgi:serine/threonine protein kinase